MAIASRTCPACATPSLRPAGDRRQRRWACAHCGVCWETADRWSPVDPLDCPGCPERTVCESRPSPLVREMSSVHRITGGTRVLVRPLLYSDRHELAEAYLRLTEETRRRRFLMARPELSDDDLEYLTNLDYRNHFAWVAFDLDSPGRPGIGVGRFVRNPARPEEAEAAVTVADAYQHRGLGTLLLLMLIDQARTRGITSFVSYMSWENEETLASLREAGAVVEPDEPGIARVRIDIPSTKPSEHLPLVRAVLASFARRR